MISYPLNKTNYCYKMRDGLYSTPFPDIKDLSFKSGKNKGKLNYKKVNSVLIQWIIDNSMSLATRTNNKILKCQYIRID